jgi:predicted alpha-1,2-mannosidase
MFIKRALVVMLLGTAALSGCRKGADDTPAGQQTGISKGTFEELKALDASTKEPKAPHARTDLVQISSETDAGGIRALIVKLEKRVTAAEAEQKAGAHVELDGITKEAASLSARVTAAQADTPASNATMTSIVDKIKELRQRIGKLAALEPEVREDIAGLTAFVNAFIGTDMTDSNGGHSGNDNPGAQTPFGMVSFGPDTRGSGSAWGKGSGGYSYDDRSIRHFSMTHLNGPGCRGQGGVVMMPSLDTTSFSSADSPYNHRDETAEPGYYKVAFTNNIVSELTATTRTGMAQFNWPDAAKAVLLVDSNQSNNLNVGTRTGESQASITLASDYKSVSGKSVVGAFCGGTWRKPVYFHMTFDKPLKPATSTTKKGVARLHFDLDDADKSVRVKIGISSVSTANAKLNLESENKDLSFEAVRAQASKNWNERLNTIQLDLARPEELAKLSPDKLAAARTHLTKFYSALYRVYSGPTVYSDVNGEYRSMKQKKPFPAKDTVPVRATENVANYKFMLNGKEAGYKTHYSGFSMWDTYRSQAQLLALVEPKVASEMMQSLVADAKQCGALPHWVDGSDDTIPMQGDHAPNIVAGSYAFGARNFDIESMRAFMKQSAFDDKSTCNDKLSVGRDNDQPVLPTYKRLGYVPTAFPSNHWHAGSATIELVTTDRSIGTFLKSLPSAAADSKEISKLIGGKTPRASNWINIFDDSRKKLRGKDKDGKWAENADMLFHESTEENYIWAFAHDWTALIEKLGGNNAAIARLNALFGFKDFSGPEPTGKMLNSSESGRTFYIGNEPAFQTPWAYNWAGSPKHAQYIIPIIMNKNFSTGPGGLPGNDDMGATSTWYVLAALGLYPVIPSEAGFAVSTPQFSGINLWLGNGRKLRIESDRQGLLDNVRYIRDMKLGGRTYSGTWLPLERIAKGGKLSFTLSEKPTDWGSAPELAPPSGPDADYGKATARSPVKTQMIP